jgi:hypothetical protein
MKVYLSREFGNVNRVTQQTGHNAELRLCPLTEIVDRSESTITNLYEPGRAIFNDPAVIHISAICLMVGFGASLMFCIQDPELDRFGTRSYAAGLECLLIPQFSPNNS